MMRWFSKVGVWCVLCGAAVGQQAPAAKVAFGIADVHESPRMRIPYPDGGQLHGDRYVLRQSTLVDMVALAYGVKTEMVQGGPSWLELQRFDVVAKADPRTSDADLKVMLQGLLAERFKLVVHKGEAPMPAYLLTAPGGKTKMRRSDDGEERNCRPDPAPQTAGGAPLVVIACTGMSTEELANFVNQAAASYLTEPVLDETKLEGKWDFTLKWTDFRQRAKAGAEAISIFDAVEKDLGLKLELKTAPRPVLLVDSATERPTANLPEAAKELPEVAPAQFEVATIKPSRPDARQGGRIVNGQVSLAATTLGNLINFAWDLSPNDPQMVVNAPAWLNDDKFDILAKAAVPETIAGRQPAQVDDYELRQMLRALLVERFKMQVRMEDRPIYAYTMVADHPKLKDADPKSRTRCKEGPGPDGKDPRALNPILTVLWTCHNITMKELGEQLAVYSTGYIYTPVVDDTGLTGRYDLTLTWSSASLTILKPPPPPGEPAAPSDPNGAVTLYDAMHKQLGIRMVKEKRPVPVLVIDHIEEMPTAN